MIQTRQYTFRETEEINDKLVNLFVNPGAFWLVCLLC